MRLCLQAVQFYVKLLGNQEQKPEERQRIYLRDFLNVIRQHCPDKVVGSLQIPLVHDHLLRSAFSIAAAQIFFRFSFAFFLFFVFSSCFLGGNE